MTFEEAARLDSDSQAGEIVAGEWVPVTRGTWRHGAIASNVVLLFKLYARQNPGWSVATCDPGAKLGHDPQLLRGPDVAMARTERLPTGKGAEGWLEGAPDVAIEVMSENESASTLTKKALEYLAAGARIVWVVDPEPRRVMVFTPPDHVRIVGAEDSLDGGDALPGFRCTVAEIFE
jgi:Uma2 family endonuclease